MHKLFRKFGSLALVICTVVAFAALPVSAQAYIYTDIPDPELVDANGCKFTPGLSVKGDDAVFIHMKMSGTIRTTDYTLSLQDVYALTRGSVTYNDEAHSYDDGVCCERVGVLGTNVIYILNRHTEAPDNRIVLGKPIYITPDEQDPQEWFSVTGAAMLSNDRFTVTTTNDGYKIYRFPSALGPFHWSSLYTYADIMAS